MYSRANANVSIFHLIQIQIRVSLLLSTDMTLETNKKPYSKRLLEIWNYIPVLTLLLFIG